MSEVKKPMQRQMLFMENVAQSTYSNYVHITSSPGEFKLYFCQLDQNNNALVTDHISISPVYIKNIANGLQEQISKYEERYEVILPVNENEYLENGIKKQHK